jgi:phage I-like protein
MGSKYQAPDVLSAQPLPEDRQTFRLLPAAGTYTRERAGGAAETVRYRLTADDLAGIVRRSGYGEAREIPVDFEHALHFRASEEGLEEGEYLERHEGERLAAGFVQLRAAADGIYADVAGWSARALQILRDGMVKYFSPVIHGFGGSKPRITSVGLTNHPALDGIEPLVLTAEDHQTHTQKEEDPMDPKLLKLLGLDEEETLALSADAQTQAVIQAVEAMQTKQQELQKQVDTMTAEKTDAKRAELIEQGKESGQLTEAMDDWAQAQTVEALTAFLEVAPKVVPLTSHKSKFNVPKDLQPKNPEAEAIASATDNYISREYGEAAGE